MIENVHPVSPVHSDDTARSGRGAPIVPLLTRAAIADEHRARVGEKTLGL